MFADKIPDQIMPLAAIESEDDYESLPANCPPYVHMVAGAMAGIGEHTVIYPVDLVKTRMQALGPNGYSGVISGLRSIFIQEGLSRSWRGVSALISGAGPAHAGYYTAFEFVKHKLHSSETVRDAFQWIGAPILHHPLSNAVAGCSATIFHDAWMTPAEVVKQRMQMCNSPFRSCHHCVSCIYTKEGVHAFYRSFTTQLSMNLPFHGIQFMTYELLQDMLNPSRKYSPLTHVLSGALAGGIAAGLTTPLDVCKTVLNTQDSYVLSRSGTTAVDGMFSTLRSVYRLAGFRGFFRGIQARVLYHMPGTAVSWSIYEFCKRALASSSAFSSSSPSSPSSPSSSSPSSSSSSSSSSPAILTPTLSRDNVSDGR